MGEITRQLADKAEAAGAEIVTGEAVTELKRKRRHAVVVTDGDRRAVDRVVVATQPTVAARLTPNSEIPTEAVGCVTQYYRLDGPPLETGKRLLLNAGDTDPNTVVPLSEVAPEYAAGDDHLLNATFLGDVFETPSQQLAARTRETLESWYPERSFESLSRLETDRIRFAQFAQPPGTHDALPDVRDGGRRTYLAGEYTEWSSIQGAMESGRKAAGAVLEDL